MKYFFPFFDTAFLGSTGLCGGLNVECSPQAWMFEYLGPIGQGPLGRLWKGGEALLKELSHSRGTSWGLWVQPHFPSTAASWMKTRCAQMPPTPNATSYFPITWWTVSFLDLQAKTNPSCLKLSFLSCFTKSSPGIPIKHELVDTSRHQLIGWQQRKQ